MKILAVIPSRFASTRFPGKPLIDIKGKTMIQRVFEQAKQCKSFADVIVATDDERIYNHVIEFGGKAMMTSEKHPSGTDRCAEVLSKIDQKYDAVVNVQGDEPFIQPDLLDGLISRWKETKCRLVTAVAKIQTTERLMASSVVKVVRAESGEAIYFSRSPIPHLRGVDPNEWVARRDYWVHIGVYGYDRATLAGYSKLAPTELETVESLEQLRFLAHGFTFQTVVTQYHPVAIDTPEDLEVARKML